MIQQADPGFPLSALRAGPRPVPASASDALCDARRFVRHAFLLARDLEIDTVVALADDASGRDLVEEFRTGERLVWLVRDELERISTRAGDAVVEVPGEHLSRTARLRVGLYLAALEGRIPLTQRVLCVTGAARAHPPAMLLVTSPREDFPWLEEAGLARTRRVVAPREFARLLRLGLQFAAEGREGKPIGTAFVLGDAAELSAHVRQLILNPLEGHPESARNLHNPEFVETLRELTALDGAVVVTREGTVSSAGTYLDAPVGDTQVKPGWGARHAAAAALTRATDAICVVISESSGKVTVLDDGEAVFELDRAG